MENDFLLQYVDASWKFLDHRAAFRFQVGQLVAQVTGCWVQLIAEKEILLVVASLVVHCSAIKKNVIVASQLYDIADEQFTVEKEGSLELF